MEAKELLALAAFQDSAAKYFENLAVEAGEDMAFQANASNARNCRRTAAALRAHASEGE
ncbi:hypothetical protein [Stakelama pacifica]|uniref:Uncharacterized protein n=1 Tax=Stakelama pacifica TaxID=517720 RepID=A0A4R6FK21_9SPHN|nr:hypothetical protein [Stakelama pacifica]TDN81763.1 hypothetical protein EV664_107165 [Stakelama pacifica]GGO96499.1 hypothetical protein GCM10011329_23170 [Stakelama pacifica]